MATKIGTDLKTDIDPVQAPKLKEIEQPEKILDLSDATTFAVKDTRISVKAHAKATPKSTSLLNPDIKELQSAQKSALKHIDRLTKSLQAVTITNEALKDPTSSSQKVFELFCSLPEGHPICQAIEQALSCDNGLDAVKKDPFLLLRIRNYDGLNLLEQVQEQLKIKIEKQNAIIALADLELYSILSMSNPESFENPTKTIQIAMDKFEALPKQAKEFFCYNVWKLSGQQCDGQEFVLQKRDITMFVSFEGKNICKDGIFELHGESQAPFQFNTMYVDKEGLRESDPVEVKKAFHQLIQITNFLNFLRDPYKLNNMDFMTKKFNELDPELKAILPSLVSLGSTYPDQFGPMTVQAPIDFNLLADLRDVSGTPILEKIAVRLHAKIQAHRQLEQLAPLLKQSISHPDRLLLFKQLDPQLQQLLYSRTNDQTVPELLRLAIQCLENPDLNSALPHVIQSLRNHSEDKAQFLFSLLFMKLPSELSSIENVGEKAFFNDGVQVDPALKKQALLDLLEFHNTEQTVTGLLQLAIKCVDDPRLNSSLPIVIRSLRELSEDKAQFLFFLLYEKLPSEMRSLEKAGEKAFFNDGVKVDPALKKQALQELYSQICLSEGVDHFSAEGLLPVVEEELTRLKTNASYVLGQECFQPRIALERIAASEAKPTPEQPEELVRFSAAAIKSAQVFHTHAFPGGTHLFNSDQPMMEHEISSSLQDEDLQHLAHKVAKHLPLFEDSSHVESLNEIGISTLEWGVFEDKALPEWTFQIAASPKKGATDAGQIQRYNDILQTVIEKEGLRIDLPKLCIIPTSDEKASLFVKLEKKAVGEDFKTAFYKLSAEDQKRCSRDLCRLIALTGFDAICINTMTIHNGRIQIHDLPLKPAHSIESARANAKQTLLKIIEECKKEYVSPWNTPERYDEGFIILRQAAEEQFSLLEERDIQSPKTIKAFRSFAAVITDPSSTIEMKQAAFAKVPKHLQEFLYFCVWGGLNKLEQVGDSIEEFGKKKTLSNLDILTYLSSKSGMNILEQIETRFSLCEAEELFRLAKRALADEHASPLVFHAFVTTLQQKVLGSSLLAPIANHLDKLLVQLSEKSIPEHAQFEEIRKALVGTDGKEGLLDTYIRTLDSSKRRITCFAMAQRVKLNRLFKQDAFPVKPVPIEKLRVQGEPVNVQELPQGMKVLLVAYECSKYGLKLGGLGEAIYGMAKSLKDKGCEVTILMPKFAGLPNEIQKKIQEGQSTTLRHMVSGQMKEDRVWTFKEEGITLAYLEDTNAERNMFEIASGALVYKDGNLADPDRPWHGLRERMAYVGSAAAEYIAQHSDEYDAVLYNDWHAAYSIDRLAHRHFDEWVCGKFPANVFVIHNNSFGCQGVYDLEDQDILRMFGDQRKGLNVMLQGIELADRSVTVSETFALEMQDGPLTSGIGPWVRRAADEGKFHGIINGSNPDLWNPETNKALKEWKDPETGQPIDLTFSPQTKDLVAHKQMIRFQLYKALQKYYPEALKAMNCKSPEDFINNPLLLYVGRYDASQKGLDKFKPMMEAAHAKGGHFICMGTEEINGATEILDDLQGRAEELQCGWITRGHEQQSLKMQIGNAERGAPALGPLIRASTDFCLVPSCFEPCGLVQGEGWLFGAPAIGTKTGGLADTIVSDQASARFNGFTYPRLYDWNSPDQDIAAAKAVEEAITFWTSLGKEEKNQMISRLMVDGRQLSWTTSPSGLSPVDRYLVTLKEAIEAKKVRQTQPVDLIGVDESPAPASDDYFGQGVQSDLYTQFGAQIVDQKGVQFRVMAPAAKNVSVVIIEPNGKEVLFPMEKLQDGSWKILIEGAKEGTVYQYEIETAQGKIVRKNDPFALGFEPTKRQSSQVVASPREFEWTDKAWMQTRKERKDGPVNIYEVHIPSWLKPDSKYINFVDIAKQLGPYCKKMGFTHVELYGLCEHFVDESMGYQVSGYFAPTSRNGSLKDFQEFVNIMHESGIAIIYDFVPAHFVIDDCSLREFDGTQFFEESDIRNRDSSWGTLLFNFNRNDVRNFLLSSARFFLDECHLDGIRVDAVAHFTSYSRWRDKFTWNPGPDGTQFNRGGIQFAKDFNRMAHERDALTIAENSWRHDLSDTSPVDCPNGLGFDLRFNMEARSKSLEFLRASNAERAEEHNKKMYRQVMCDLPKEKFMGPYLCHDEIKPEDRGHIVEHIIRHPDDSEQDIDAKTRLYFTVNAFSPQHARMTAMGTEFGLSGKWDLHSSLGWEKYEQMPTHRAHQEEYARINHFYLEHPAFWSAGKDMCDFSWIPLDTQGSLIAYERRDPRNPGIRYLVIHNFANQDFEHLKIRAKEQEAIQEIKKARTVFQSNEPNADALQHPKVTFAYSQTSDNMKATGMKIKRVPKYSTVVIEEILEEKQKL